jgi:pseudaminic acid cytidylyltransferase
MNICVIPARGGSKRIPRKNIKEFNGRPIIAYSIKAALSSKCFDRVIVSTDDKEIAEVSMKFGAEVPFIRPKDLSDDVASTPAVMKHAAKWIYSHNPEVENICCLFATAPLLNPLSIVEGLCKMKEKNVDYVITLGRYSSPIQRAMRIGNSGSISMFSPENFYKRSQDLEQAYFDAGQFYWGNVKAWILEEFLFSDKTRAVILKDERVQDIDAIEDWKLAEIKANYIL